MSRTGLSGQLRLVAVLKSTQLVGMALFTVLAPRFMGPTRFGEFAVILSVSGLTSMLCTVGGQSVFGRFVPEYVARGEYARTRVLFMHVFGFRVATVLLVAPVLYVILRRLLPAAPGTTLVASTLAFVAMTAASPLYGVYFGFNRLGMSMSREAFSRYLLLMLLILLGGTTSLERASFALLATHSCVLTIGLALSRRLFTIEPAAFHIPSLLRHVRFGVIVFAAGFLLRIPWRLGETVLAFAGIASAQIAFFNVASSAIVQLTRILGQIPRLMIPSLSLRQASGDEEGRDRSLGLSLKYLSIVTALFVLTLVVLAPTAVRLLLGEAYLGVLPNLFVLSIAALPVPLVRTALSLAVVRTRVVRSAQIGAAAIAVYGLTAMILIPAQGSLGASIAVTSAGLAAAVVAVFHLRDTRVLAEARETRNLLAMAVAGAVLLLMGLSVAGGLAAIATYLALLFVLRVESQRGLTAVLRSAGIWPEERLSP